MYCLNNLNTWFEIIGKNFPQQTFRIQTFTFSNNILFWDTYGEHNLNTQCICFHPIPKRYWYSVPREIWGKVEFTSVLISVFMGNMKSWFSLSSEQSFNLSWRFWNIRGIKLDICSSMFWKHFSFCIICSMSSIQPSFFYNSERKVQGPVLPLHQKGISLSVRKEYRFVYKAGFFFFLVKEAQ